jgi:hypothetical protein
VETHASNGAAAPTANPSLADAVMSAIASDPASLLADETLELAVALDHVGFERLRMRLSTEVRAQDVQAFVRSVRTRSRETTAAKRHRGGPPQDDRPEILISEDEHRVNEQAARALGNIPDLYRRLNSIVRVVEAKHRRPGEEHPYVSTEVRIVTEPLLRQYFTKSARWVEYKEDPAAGGVKVPAHPPAWSVSAVASWHDWPSIKPLYHVSEAPVLLPDGRVIQRRGYDDRTGIYCNTKINVEVPERLTQDDAKAAAARLLELVEQVPFENAAHRSGWVAALLSVVGRWAFKGQCPLFMFDANREGTGKGFLVNIISGIALGRPCDFFVQTADEEEERKRITSKVLTAQPIVLIDEVDKPFGSGPLQGLLTSGVWSDRLLGGNDAPSFPAYIVWFAAGNNVQLKSGDIQRRTCFVRIVTDLDNPAERTGFKIDDMPAHVEAHRAELFEAALVMLRAWLLSGLRHETLPGWVGRWGSVDDWDRVVRGAIVFAGLADPMGAKATSVAQNVREGLAELVSGLEEAVAKIGTNGEASISEIHAALADNDAKRKEIREAWSPGSGVTAPSVNFTLLRKGIASLSPQLKGQTPTGHQLGVLLGRNKAQPVKLGEVRKWIQYRHSDGGLWRVDVIATKPVDVAATPYDDLVARLRAEEAPCIVCQRKRGETPDACRPCGICARCTTEAPYHPDGCHC